MLETVELESPDKPRNALARTVRVTHPQGLHLRPCCAIVNAVSKHRAQVIVRSGSQTANAANIFDLLSLGAVVGTELVLFATGTDAEEAIEALAELLANGAELAQVT